MDTSAEQSWKFAALHRQLCRLHISEKFSSGTKNHKQSEHRNAGYKESPGSLSPSLPLSLFLSLSLSLS